MVVVPGGRWRLSASAVLTLAASAAPLFTLRAQDPAPAASTGAVAGRVTEAPGDAPVGGARVQAVLLPGGAAAGAANTSAEGRYRVGGLRPGTYVLRVSRIGFQLRQVDTVRVVAGETATANVALSEAASTLDQVVVTSSRAPEKILDAPASIAVVNTATIARRPAVTVVDQVRDVPGVSATQGGLAQTNVTVRGFNNAFSGALLTLQDYRFASVPSLRVNVPFLVPGTTEDVERIEVLLGPASALYGPNSANGVLHVITKSPFSSAGTTVTLDGGERNLFRGGLRHASILSDKVAFKVSGEYFTGRDFEYRDPAEPATFPSSSIPARRGQANTRDFGVRRYTGEGRLDWRPAAGVEAITTVGRTNVGNQIELTSANGASRNHDWTFTALQQRLRWNRLFVQAFANISDAGNSDSLDARGTYLLRTGQPIVDKSRVYAAQAQHAADFGGDRQRFVYGVDYIHTDPRTGGTTNGRNEAIDNTDEVGAYVQSTTRVVPRLDLITALRADRHSELEGTFVSPRAALQYKPGANHSVRFAYNRAFQTPANFNYFLDLDQQRRILGLPAALRDIDITATGVPAGGLQYRRNCAAGAGGLCMRSPFTPAAAGGPDAFVPANAAPYYSAALGLAVAGGLANSLTGAGLTAAQAQAVIGLLGTANVSGVGTYLGLLDPSAPRTPQTPFQTRFTPVQPGAVTDLPRLKPNFLNNFEVGYKGIFRDKVRLSVDGWYQQRKDFLSAAVNVSPNVFLDSASLRAALTTTLTPALGPGAGPVALAVANGLRAVPLGTVAPDSRTTTGPDIYFSYVNINKSVNVTGVDAAADYLITNRWSVMGNYSYVSDVEFPDVRLGVAPLALNAPGHRAAAAVRWNDEASGFSTEVRGRYADAFPVNSGVFVGRVPVNAFLDANVSFRVPGAPRGLTFSVNGTNLLDNRVRSFVGVPQIGRLVVSRVRYEF